MKTTTHPDPGSNVRCSLLVVRCCLSAALIPLTSCSNPLAPIDADYDRHLAAAPERLRSIDRFDSDRFRRPEDKSESAPDPAARPPSRLEGLESLPLTLEQARAAALANNLDIKVALVDPTILNERLREEEARFEAVFRPSIGYAENDAPTLDRTASNQQNTGRAGLGVSVPLRTGGRASIDYTQGFNETDNPFFTLNSSHNNAVELALQQPLLRGAGRRVNTYPIRIAEYNRQIGEAATKLEVIRQLAAVDKAYWVLAALKLELEVRQAEFEFARDDLARAQRLVQNGASPEIEAIRAESAAARTLTGIIEAENAVLQQQRELKRLMNMPELPLESGTLIEPATAADPVPFRLDRAELGREALANRMEMLEVELRLAQDYSTIEFTKNQALPSFVLDYRYSIDGLGATLSDSQDVLRGGDFTSWSFSITGEIPIGNEAAEARVRQAILARLQRLSTRDARQKAISQEVYSAIDRIESGWQQILAARQSAATALRTYEAEKRRYEAGGGTNTDVIDANTRLANARSQIVRAVATYQVAQVDLAFATGTLLGAGRIDWSPVDAAEGEKQGPNDPTPSAFPIYPDPFNIPKPTTGQNPSMGNGQP